MNVADHSGFQPASSSCLSPETITVVTGLPRSGTSLMMRMLEDGGMEVLTDMLRPADIDNPYGYFEFERAKGLDKGDEAWLELAKGRAVKVISALLEYLPARYFYRVIFMHRNLEEILASQTRMLAHREEPTDTISDEEMARILGKHLHKVRIWLAQQVNAAVLDIDFGPLVTDPRPHAERANEFLGKVLDVDRMVSAVDPGLYRNRAR